MPPANVKRQPYPRIQDETNDFYDFLDDSKLTPHAHKIEEQVLYSLIDKAIKSANASSSKRILAIPVDATPEYITAKYTEIAEGLFFYFQSYTSDPASTSLQLHNRNCREVAKEQYRNNTLQKERMNSGWRYQFLAVDCAQRTGRFVGISDLNQIESVSMLQ